MMHACALTMDIHIPASNSLKSKRTVVKHLVDVSKARYGVAAAEVDHQSKWQRSELGFAAVAESPRHVEDVLDAVERFIWSHPELQVLAQHRSWFESGA
jgi:uncharacterized protein